MRTAFGCEFDVPDGYLNTASVGMPPAPVADAVAAAVQALAHRPRPPARLRRAHRDAPAAAFADLVGVPPDAGGDRRRRCPRWWGCSRPSVPDGARVLVAAGEFTSVTLAVRRAVRPRASRWSQAELEELGERAAGVRRRRGQRGAVRRRPPRRPGRAARRRGRRGTRVVLDATQALGWLAADLSFADAVVGGAATSGCSARGARRGSRCAPSWPVGAAPRGLVRRGRRLGQRLRAAAAPRRPTARALDTSPAWYCHAGAAVALPWLAGLDRAAVQAHCVGPGRRVLRRRGAAARGLGDRRGASARTPLDRLAAAGVVASARAGAARLAFHLYNTDDERRGPRDSPERLRLPDQGRPGKTGTAGVAPTTARHRAHRAGRVGRAPSGPPRAGPGRLSAPAGPATTSGSRSRRRPAAAAADAGSVTGCGVA